MIEPSSFAIHVTYTCPLTCAHCCFKSSPQNKDHLDPSEIMTVIERLEPSIKMVAFTGGEPFLLGQKLVDLVKCANDRGFVTRIVTSGYFGLTYETAEKRLKELVDAGLKELSISWDDFHEEFVKFETIKNVVRAAKSLQQLTVAINIVQAESSKWNAKRVKEELGWNLQDVVCETPLNLTGRADEKLHDAGFREDRLLGPCPYILTGPTLSAKNKLLACCGVIPDTERLYIDGDFSPDRMNDSLMRAKKSILFNWIYLRGPYAIMEWMSKKYGITIPKRDSVGGNCQACKHLFETPEIEALLDKALLEKGPEVMDELYLLESLGISDPKSMVRLWYTSPAPAVG